MSSNHLKFQGIRAAVSDEGQKTGFHPSSPDGARPDAPPGYRKTTGQPGRGDSAFGNSGCFRKGSLAALRARKADPSQADSGFRYS
jgi:hypothetical protein